LHAPENEKYAKISSLGDYLRKFSKQIETIPMAYSGASWTLIYEKT
jgi:hypothetical protein